MKKRDTAIVISCLFVLIFSIIVMIMLADKEEKNRGQILSMDYGMTKKIEISDTIVERLKKQNKMIALEIGTSQEIEVSKSFWDLEVFRKSKNIRFYGNGEYTVDLSNFNKNNIEIDEEKKRVTIYIDKPVLDKVYIDGEKTVFKKSENGILAFGDYKVTPEEYSELEENAKRAMERALLSEEYMYSAEKAAEKNMEELVDAILQGEYEITVKTKEDETKNYS